MSITVNNTLLKQPCFAIVKDVLCNSVQGELVLLHLNRESYYSISGASLLIWQALQNHQPLEVAIEHITAQYEVDTEQAIVDLQEFLQDLLDQHLIVPLAQSNAD